MQSLGIDRVRRAGFLSREVLSLREVGMVENGRKRSGGVLVPTFLLVLFTSRAACVIRVLIIFEIRVLNLRQAKVNQFLYAFFFILW